MKKILFVATIFASMPLFLVGTNRKSHDGESYQGSRKASYPLDDIEKSGLTVWRGTMQVYADRRKAHQRNLLQLKINRELEKWRNGKSYR